MVRRPEVALVPDPARGDVWLAELDPTRGREQAGRRPVLVVSADVYNQGPSGLVVVVPITSTVRGIPLHAHLVPPEGGLRVDSAILCDQVRTIAKERLRRRWGAVTPTTMQAVEARLRTVLAL
jgi:mRNA interferase MazF